MVEVNYNPAEQDEVLAIFADMLSVVTKDGGNKRARGEKPSWKVDRGHEAALYRHLQRWERGDLVDGDSGAHALVHVAWRALAIAYQEDWARGVD